MKKYKLIKQYPGSVVLGTIAQPNDLIQHDFFEKYSEFWQEVIEKDYEILISRVVPQEILSVKRLSDGEVFTIGDRAKTITSKGKHTVTQLRIRQKCTGRDGKGGWNYDGIDRIWIDWEDDCGGNWLESTEKVIEKDYEILSYLKKGSTTCTTTKRRSGENHDEYWTIHKIKRLSDGEVFTVGDLIKTPYTDCTRITGFKNPERNEYFIEIPTGLTRLLFLEKAKNPIFLTHDGEDIFEGDKVWHVNKDALYHSFLIPVSGTKFFSDINAYFLTQEAALDYIEKNKVLFTTEDRVGIKEGDMYYFVDTDFSIHTMKAHSGAGQYSERKYFSTVEEAHEYVMQNVKAFSIKDFWEITCMSTSNFNKSTYMRDLVKKALGIK
jgi:hypothetical protein